MAHGPIIFLQMILNHHYDPVSTFVVIDDHVIY